MSFTYHQVKLHKPATGVVVRPRGDCIHSNSASCDGKCSCSGPGCVADPQTLVFFSDEIRELHKTSASPRLTCANSPKQASFHLSEDCLAVQGSLKNAACAVYEPTSDSVFFGEVGSAVMRLDKSNTISLVAGSITERASLDGRGDEARFSRIYALAADGKGNVFVADGAGPSRIRVLRASTGDVVTVRSSAPHSYYWCSLSYDTVADVLVAATTYAVCHLPMYGSSAMYGWSTSPRLVAGHWSQGGCESGSGTAARFMTVTALLAAAGGELYIEDQGALRMMDCAEAVTDILRFKVSGQCYGRQASLLPCGELVLCGYDNGTVPVMVVVSGVCAFAPSSQVLAGWRLSANATFADLPNLLTARSNNDGSSTVVTVSAAGGKSFVVHRNVLMARSDYFKQQLTPGGGFADSGANAVSLGDVDPEALGCLFGYMYTGELVVPTALLRSAAELAGRLLMPAECIGRLQEWLLAAVTPGSVISHLMWAEQHGMTGLLPPLKAFLLRHRKEVVDTQPQAFLELAAWCPEIAADLLRKSLAI